MNSTDQQALALQQEAQGLTKILDQYRSLVVIDQQTADWAGKVLVEVKGRSKALEAQKKTATAPINQALATIRGWFRPVEDGYSQIETILKSKLCDWDRLCKQQQQAQLQAAAAAFQQGEQQQGIELLNSVQEAPTLARGTSVRMAWDFEITDQAAVPRELCSPDTKLIRAAVALGHREIPGVRVFEKPVMSVRSA